MNLRRKKKRSLPARLLPWALLALAVFFVGGYIAFRIWFFGYLKSDAFRNLIGGLTSTQLKANGEFLPFSFSDSAIYSDGYKAQGTAAAPFSSLRADQLRARINLGGFWQHAWQIDQINIERLELALGHTAGPGPGATPPPVPEEPNAAPSAPLFKWLPDHVDLRKVIIHETDLKWGENTAQPGAITNAEFTIAPEKDGAGNVTAWNILCDSGTVTQQGEPNLTIEQASLRYQRPTLFITDADLRYNSDNGINLSGEVNFGKSFDVLAKLNGIPITPLLQPDWRAKLKGNLSGDIHISAPLPMTSGPRLDGDLSLAQGELEGLPVLDQIAIFTSTERFRRVILTKVTAHFTRSDALLNVTNLIAESEGLIRIEGGFEVANGLINGTFQVGITPTSLLWLPPAMQNAVFTTSHDGYVWTTVHLSGTPEHPLEDLRARLIAAAPGAIIDTAKGVIDQVPGASTVTDEGKKLIDTVLSPLNGK